MSSQSEYPEVARIVITKLSVVLLSWRLQTSSCGWRRTGGTGGRVRIPRTSQSRPMQLSRYFKHNFATNWIRVGSSDNISVLTSVHASNSILEEDDVTGWKTQWWLEKRRELWYNLNIFIWFTKIFGKFLFYININHINQVYNENNNYLYRLWLVRVF